MDPPKPQSPQYALKKEVIYGAPAPAGLSDTTIMHQSKLLDRSFAWPSCVLPGGLTGSLVPEVSSNYIPAGACLPVYVNGHFARWQGQRRGRSTASASDGPRVVG